MTEATRLIVGAPAEPGGYGSDIYSFLPAGSLAEAFPESSGDHAIKAARYVSESLQERQWTQLFEVLVEKRGVRIPDRLGFTRRIALEGLDGAAALMARCLETRSHNGFQRQQALASLLRDTPPWAAPFVVKLIGEYVVEILEDIDAATSPRLMQALGEFVRENPSFWQLTKQRVASYWDVYYRCIPRRDYVGFRLIKRVEDQLQSHVVNE